MSCNVVYSLVPSSPHSRSSNQEGTVTGQTEVIHGSQVVAVGTPLLTASLPLGAQQGPVMVGVCVVKWSYFLYKILLL